MEARSDHRGSGRGGTGDLAGDDDRPAALLHDDTDRAELRQRYYGLLQELRVLLPGVQVLLAFLFTVPFASHFGELDGAGRAAFGVSMCSAMAATVAFAAPIAFHRVGHRRARSARLVWAIRMEGAGLVFMCVALLAGLYCVMRFVYGGGLAAAVTGVVVVMIVLLWVAVPLLGDDAHGGGAD